MSELIAEALTEHWGERCADFEPECNTCRAWAAYDALEAADAKVAEAARKVEGWKEVYDRQSKLREQDVKEIIELRSRADRLAAEVERMREALIASRAHIDGSDLRGDMLEVIDAALTAPAPGGERNVSDPTYLDDWHEDPDMGAR